jgi:hypothetical protein
MSIPQILLVGDGLFTIAGGVFDWDWFMGHWKSHLFLKLNRRRGARILHIVLGLRIAGFGAFWVK